jgi:hypothetical protein
VIAPAGAAARHIPAAAPPTPTTAVVTLAAGSVVPLHVDMESGLIGIPATASLPVRIARKTEVALSDGQPDGRYRLDDGPWHSVKDGVLVLRIDRITPRLAEGSPEIRMHGNFVFHGEQP